jgi:hypothetical protein
MEKNEFDGIMDNYVNSAEIKMKKGIVQTFFWVIATIAVYFVWGTEWYFWVLFVISLILVISLVVTKIFLAKTQKSLDDIGRIQDDLAEMRSSFNDEIEELEYTEQQKVLEKLLTDLEEIGEEHGEIYDTECREQMREVIHNAFVFQKEEYVMPNTFGLYSPEGNEFVAKALNRYLIAIEPLTQDVQTAKERLAIFQDDEVYSEGGESLDEFFGWVDEEDLK